MVQSRKKGEGCINRAATAGSHEYVFSRRKRGQGFAKKDCDENLPSHIRDCNKRRLNYTYNPFFIVNENLKIVFLNESLKRLLKSFRHATNLAGLRLFEAFPSMPERIVEEYRTVFRSGEPLITEENHTVRGIVHHLEIAKTPVIDRRGAVEEVITTIRDVTEKTMAERSLDESQLLVRTLLDLPEDSVVFVLDSDFRILDFNKNLPESLRVPKEYLVKKYCFDFFPPEIARIRKEKTEEAIRTDKPVRFEDEFRGVRFDIIIYPIHDTEGNITKIAIFATNVTARKKIEEALRESEARFRRLAENAPDMIFRISLSDGRYEYASPAATRIIGYTPEELYTSPFIVKKLLHADWVEWFAQQWERLIRSGEIEPVSEWRSITKSGRSIWLRQTNSVVRDDTGMPVALEGIVSDITDHKLMEAELRAHRDQLEQQVKQRTEDLEKANAELKTKSSGLEELNTALRVLLRQREDDKKDMEQRFVSNIKKLVLPNIEKLRNNHLDARQRSLIDIVEANLNEIVAPFLNSLQQYNLTPKELFIASLIKDGKTTKEIAEIAGTACSSVDSHRNRIREKLGLNRQKINLQSYLRNLG